MILRGGFVFLGITQILFVLKVTRFLLEMNVNRSYLP